MSVLSHRLIYYYGDTIMWFYKEGQTIEKEAKRELVRRVADEARKKYGSHPKRVLLLPPDKTRYHSGSGEITNWLYHHFAPGAEVHVIPTLGQHVPHTPEENQWMFGDIPEECILKHDWRNSCTQIGEIPGDYIKEVSDGMADWPLPVQINSDVVSGKYDLIINIGQVVPHEVLGYANHNKNYFIGLASKEMICAAHMMAGSYGIENNLGQLITPLRACFNKAEHDYLKDLPHLYIQLVLTRDQAGALTTTGFYVGEGVDTYLAAARYARERCITMFDTSVKKVVAVMDAREFNSTWVANKAVYRTRMAIADGGELVIIAPGVERFGEQPEVDGLIRKYGYKGTPYVLEQYRNNADLQDLGHAAAHLLHGSSEGRFTITYAPGKLSKAEVEGVGFSYLSLDEATRRYQPDRLRDGFNDVGGEQIFFISSPSLGLWASREKYEAAQKKNTAFINKLSTKEPQAGYLRELTS